MSTNNLLMIGLLYKWMRLHFFVYLLEAELSKQDGASSKYQLEFIDSKITKEGHISNWRTKELSLEFTLILIDDEFKVKQTDALQENLKRLGFSRMKIRIQEWLMDLLCKEYLEFVIFPLIIYSINEENKKKTNQA